MKFRCQTHELPFKNPPENNTRPHLFSHFCSSGLCHSSQDGRDSLALRAARAHVESPGPRGFCRFLGASNEECAPFLGAREGNLFERGLPSSGSLLKSLKFFKCFKMLQANYLQHPLDAPGRESPHTTKVDWHHDGVLFGMFFFLGMGGFGTNVQNAKGVYGKITFDLDLLHLQIP